MPLLTSVVMTTMLNAGLCIIKHRNTKQTLQLCDRNCFEILFYVKALSWNDTISLNKKDSPCEKALYENINSIYSIKSGGSGCLCARVCVGGGGYQNR